MKFPINPVVIYRIFPTYLHFCAYVYYFLGCFLVSGKNKWCIYFVKIQKKGLALLIGNGSGAYTENWYLYNATISTHGHSEMCQESKFLLSRKKNVCFFSIKLIALILLDVISFVFQIWLIFWYFDIGICKVWLAHSYIQRTF